MPSFTFYGGRKQATSNDELFFLFLNLSAVPKKSTPGKFPYIRNFQQIGINTTKVGKTPIHFKSHVFDAVTFVDAKNPYFRQVARFYERDLHIRGNVF